MNPLSDFACDVLFSSLKGDPLEGMNHKELRVQKGEVVIVINSCTMVSPLRQCITFSHCVTQAMVHHEIKPRQIQGPLCLSLIELLHSHEVFEVLMVWTNLKLVLRSLQEVVPLF